MPRSQILDISVVIHAYLLMLNMAIALGNLVSSKTFKLKLWLPKNVGAKRLQALALLKKK